MAEKNIKKCKQRKKKIVPLKCMRYFQGPDLAEQEKQERSIVLF